VFGVGKNPIFEEKEKERKMKMARRKMQSELENSDRIADL
jgi:hypothetical protein